MKSGAVVAPAHFYDPQNTSLRRILNATGGKMKNRCLYLVIGLTTLLALVQAQVAPQTVTAKPASKTQTYTPPRSDDGHPDLSGFWSNNNATPLERPKELAGRAMLTDEELAAMKKKAHELFGG